MPIRPTTNQVVFLEFQGHHANSGGGKRKRRKKGEGMAEV